MPTMEFIRWVIQNQETLNDCTCQEGSACHCCLPCNHTYPTGQIAEKFGAGRWWEDGHPFISIRKLVLVMRLSYLRTSCNDLRKEESYWQTSINQFTHLPALQTLSLIQPLSGLAAKFQTRLRDIHREGLKHLRYSSQPQMHYDAY